MPILPAAMDDVEIQLRLSACRPNGRDHDDPLLREALDALPHREDLNDWFAREQAFDAAVSDRLASLRAPESLRAEILAAARIREPVPRWQRLPWLAAVAAIVLAALIAVIMTPGTSPAFTLARFQADMVDLSDELFTPSLPQTEGGLTRVGAWLEQQGAPSPHLVQPGTRSAQPLGCRVMDWHGHKVAVVCFRRDGQEAHLFIMERRDLHELPDQPLPPECGRMQGYPVMYWTCRKCIYMMVGGTPETDLTIFR